jgi:hypothetical protein
MPIEDTVTCHQCRQPRTAGIILPCPRCGAPICLVGFCWIDHTVACESPDM